MWVQKLVQLSKNNTRKFAIPTTVKRNDNNKWQSVIGLEVHAQISTESKLFSCAGTSFGEPLNSAVSYFDASIPGTLPVINRKCVESGVKTALAFSCQINGVSMFDRKHYFYADLPAGYQITQQRHALANNGELKFPVIVPGKKVYYKKVRLLQLQLEQDSGKSLHDDVLKRSLVDLNRAGIPLMELVFAPDLETGEEAASLVKELILTLRRLKTCSCKMEEGALRVDANVSIHKSDEPLGVRTEIKNINSLRNISQAITFEIERQIKAVSQGEFIINETRTWDAVCKRTVIMRDKEVMQDYRFMPEPNLVPLWLTMGSTDNSDTVSVEKLIDCLPELPEQTRCNLMESYKVNQETAIILVNEPMLLERFLNIMKSLPEIPTKMVTNFLINDLLTSCNKLDISIENCKITDTHLMDIMQSLHAQDINLQAARLLIDILQEHPVSSIDDLIQQHNLQQISDVNAIKKLCETAMKNQSKAVEQYKQGKKKAIFAIAGETAKLSNQKANMKLVMKFLEDTLSS